MARLKTMTTQFIDGESNGVRVCRCALSTMTTVVIPRPLLSRAKQIEDLPLRGIYYLINDEGGAISRLYVGQTKQGIARLDDHNARKDFWNKAVLFLSDDGIGRLKKTVSFSAPSGAADFVLAARIMVGLNGKIATRNPWMSYTGDS